MKMKYILGVVAVIIVVFLLYLWLSVSVEPGLYDDLAKCMTDNGVVMYGTDWCSHCQNQKAMFGSSFNYINFVNCDNSRQACVEAGVEGYPTWRINGNNYPGEKTLEQLSSLSGCTL